MHDFSWKQEENKLKVVVNIQPDSDVSFTSIDSSLNEKTKTA